MKNLFFALILMASSTSFAAFQPKCQSDEYDKWGYCSDDSPVGQFSYNSGIAYCLKTCNQSYEEMVDQAQSNAQQAANRDRHCGFKNIRNSDWKAAVTSEITEGAKTWIKVETKARFVCER